MAQRSIFITGGGSGIGRATALHFASRGWFVGVADISETGMAETLSQIAGEAKWSGKLDVRAAATRLPNDIDEPDATPLGDPDTPDESAAEDVPELAQVIIWAIRRRTMSVPTRSPSVPSSLSSVPFYSPRVEVRLVPDLEPDEVVAQDLLPILRDLEPDVR